jgi:hypothetical protein
MRRTLFVSMALVAAVNAPAAAQTCLGLASFSNGNMQVSGNGQFTEGVNRFGAGFTYGIPAPSCPPRPTMGRTPRRWALAPTWATS